MIDQKDILVLDTETTGFDRKAEILQISVIDGSGEILMNEYFRPRFISSWPEAEAINHISPEMVADKPTFFEKKKEIGSLLHHAKILVGYNIRYDLRMMGHSNLFISKKIPRIDLMPVFAEIYREPSLHPEYGPWKWQKLTTCAEYYGYPETNWHDSLADTKATLYCFWEMVKRGHLKVPGLEMSH